MGYCKPTDLPSPQRNLIHQALRWAARDMEDAGLDPMRHLDTTTALMRLYAGILGGQK